MAKMCKKIPKICQRYAQDITKICPRYAQNMAKIWPRYANYMTNICPGQVPGLTCLWKWASGLGTLTRYAQHITKSLSNIKKKHIIHRLT